MPGVGIARGRSRVRPFYMGSFSKVYSGKSLTNENGATVLTELRQAELRGVRVDDTVLSYFGKRQTPNDVLWVLDSRHDMYCGIFDQSGDHFFSASQDGIVRIFDYCGRYFRLKREIVCHDYGWSIVSLKQSPDQRQLAFCSLCPMVNISNLTDEGTGQLHVFYLTSNIGANHVFSLSYCGISSTKLLCGRNRGRVTICNIEVGHCEELDVSQRCLEDVNAVATLDPSGDVFVAGGDDTCIRMFDTRALNEGCLASFTGHFDGITFIDSKNDGRYFLSNSKDQTVRLWDARKHSKAGSERRTKPEVSWDYRIGLVPQSYRNRISNDRQSKSVLTLSGHTVRYTLIRARFSPIHSTGQQFAYSGSAWGNWHIWDLNTGDMVSQNFVKAVTLRDVHWHPWDSRVVTSGLNGSLTCWGYRRNQAKRKPLLFTRRHSFHSTPPIISASNSKAVSRATSEEEVVDEEEEQDVPDDEQAKYYNSESGHLEHRVNLNKAGFSYRFPRRRPTTQSYTEVVSDFSDTTSTTSSLDQDIEVANADDMEEEEEGEEIDEEEDEEEEEYVSEEDPDFEPEYQAVVAPDGSSRETGNHPTTRLQARTSNVTTYFELPAESPSSSSYSSSSDEEDELNLADMETGDYESDDDPDFEPLPDHLSAEAGGSNATNMADGSSMAAVHRRRSTRSQATHRSPRRLRRRLN